MRATDRIAGLIISLGLVLPGAAAMRPAAVVTADPASAARTAAENRLLQADARHFRDMVNHDVAALKLDLADELVYVHSSSVRQSKHELLHDIEVGRAIYRHIEIRAQEPRLYGRVGIIQGVAAFVTGPETHASTFVLRYTDVYVRRDGRWQMVAWHCTRIPDNP